MLLASVHRCVSQLQREARDFAKCCVFQEKKSSVQHTHPSSLGSTICGSDCPTVSLACLAFCPTESYFEGTCSKSQVFFFCPVLGDFPLNNLKMKGTFLSLGRFDPLLSR